MSVVVAVQWTTVALRRFLVDGSTNSWSPRVGRPKACCRRGPTSSSVCAGPRATNGRPVGPRRGGARRSSRARGCRRRDRGDGIRPRGHRSDRSTPSRGPRPVPAGPRHRLPRGRRLPGAAARVPVGAGFYRPAAVGVDALVAHPGAGGRRRPRCRCPRRRHGLALVRPAQLSQLPRGGRHGHPTSPARRSTRERSAPPPRVPAEHTGPDDGGRASWVRRSTR